MEKKLKSGDTVRLKSGGPKMTVQFYTTTGEVFCKWFDKQDELRSDSFMEDALEKFGTTAN